MISLACSPGECSGRAALASASASDQSDGEENELHPTHAAQSALEQS